MMTPEQKLYNQQPYNRDEQLRIAFAVRVPEIQKTWTDYCDEAEERSLARAEFRGER